MIDFTSLILSRKTEEKMQIGSQGSELLWNVQYFFTEKYESEHLLIITSRAEKNNVSFSDRWLLDVGPGWWVYYYWYCSLQLYPIIFGLSFIPVCLYRGDERENVSLLLSFKNHHIFFIFF